MARGEKIKSEGGIEMAGGGMAKRIPVCSIHHHQSISMAYRRRGSIGKCGSNHRGAAAALCGEIKQRRNSVTWQHDEKSKRKSVISGMAWRQHSGAGEKSVSGMLWQRKKRKHQRVSRVYTVI